VQRREPLYTASATVLSQSVEGEHVACLPGHALTTLHYIVAKHAGRKQAGKMKPRRICSPRAGHRELRSDLGLDLLPHRPAGVQVGQVGKGEKEHRNAALPWGPAKIRSSAPIRRGMARSVSTTWGITDRDRVSLFFVTCSVAMPFTRSTSRQRRPMISPTLAPVPSALSTTGNRRPSGLRRQAASSLSRSSSER
jgi:hypothetical protein